MSEILVDITVIPLDTSQFVPPFKDSELSSISTPLCSIIKNAIAPNCISYFVHAGGTNAIVESLEDLEALIISIFKDLAYDHHMNSISIDVAIEFGSRSFSSEEHGKETEMLEKTDPSRNLLTRSAWQKWDLKCCPKTITDHCQLGKSVILGRDDNSIGLS